MQDKQTTPMSAELKLILPPMQLEAMRELEKTSPEYEGILAAAEKQAEHFQQLPELYATDGDDAAKIVYLHYFIGDCDWWLIERSKDGRDFFGLCQIQEAELGYVSLNELKSIHIGPFGPELDFYWEPKSLSQVIEENGLRN